MDDRYARLLQFITASKAKGASDESLTALLVRRGWPAQDIYTALGEYWAYVTGVAVPERSGSNSESSREAFLYLLAFSTLCSWATALGSAMFTFIEHWFPDPVTSNSYSEVWQRNSVTWQMATLAVSFPIFLLVMRAIVRENAAHPERLQSGVRKWLTYIALLGTAATMIGDLIWFLDALLSGGLTVRFFLKSAVVMIISGAIFWYYFHSLRSRKREEQTEGRGYHRWFAIASTAAVIATFLLGFNVTGTPPVIRERQADERRIQDLRHLGFALAARNREQSNQGTTPTTLPSSLTQLVSEGKISERQTRDPITLQPYVFLPNGGTRYQLCANFNQIQVSDVSIDNSTFWNHGIGRKCYSLNAKEPTEY